MKKIFQLIILVFAGAQLPAQCIDLNCPASPVTACDLTPNDPGLWNESYWLDPVNGLHDLADAPTDLTISADDQCPGADLSFQYELWLDTDGDGIQETVVTSAGFPAYGTVNYNNAGTPGFSGGTPQNFDERAVPANQKYGFTLEVTGSGTTKTANVRWNTTQMQGTYLVPQLPIGVHKIKWTVTNGLGNERTCEYNVVVKDCKKPTIVCLNGLSVNIMPTGLITLWAADFLQYIEDNQTPSSLLKIGIRKSGTGTGFPVDGNGDPIISVTFNCDELGTQLIELWSIDQTGNADFCETYVIVRDNLGMCGDTSSTNIVRFCTRFWCDGAIVPGVNAYIAGSGPGIPTFSFSLPPVPSAMGCAVFNTNSIPIGSNFTFFPTLNTDPLNGVNTFDLIKISKHILGIQPLPTFGMLAADATNNGSISTVDIVEFRKLLLGVYAQLPNNTSWRFVDASFVFTNPNNPFIDQFPENKTFLGPFIDLDSFYEFVAVKIGDVDCTAFPGLQAPVDDRFDPVRPLTAPDRYVEAGETVELPLHWSSTGEWLGFQFGLSYDPEFLQVESLLPGNLPEMNEDNFALFSDKINAVWARGLAADIPANEPLVTIGFRALKSGWLHEGIFLGQTLRPQAFAGDETRSRLQLEFSPELAPEGSTAIFNPRPNPTGSGATIPVQLSESGPVDLVLEDISGKSLFQFTQNLEKGNHTLELPASVFPHSGLYFWRVQAGQLNRSGKLMRN